MFGLDCRRDEVLQDVFLRSCAPEAARLWPTEGLLHPRLPPHAAGGWQGCAMPSRDGCRVHAGSQRPPIEAMHLPA